MKVDDLSSQPFSPHLPAAHAAPLQATGPAESAPTLPLLHACFLLAGFGTMLLGPILPLLARTWQLADSQLGMLLLSQFIGATLGGITVGKNLPRSLTLGLTAASLGLFTFSWTITQSGILPNSFLFGCAALFLAGLGIGLVIASTNILTGQRYTAHRASALTRLNLSFALGALLSPLLAAWLLAIPLTLRIAALALCFLAAALALSLQSRRFPLPPTAAAAEPHAPLAPRIFFYFAALLFIYGGLETCLSAWLTTYALRYGQTSLVLSAYTLVLLLAGLTAGRALAAPLLLRISERTLQRTALLLTAALAAALAAAHQAAIIAALAIVLGAALAPVFPITFAQLMPHRPSPRQAGIILAASGLGAAALPALMGLLSTRTGSLRTALVLPVAAALLMLAATALPAFSKPRVRV